MARPIRLRTDYARWQHSLPRHGARLTADKADRLIGRLCAVGLLVAVLLTVAGVI